MSRILQAITRGKCPRCNGTGGHSDFGNRVICSACGGSGQSK
jgi:DnaJ-class molecular chaperone